MQTDTQNMTIEELLHTLDDREVSYVFSRSSQPSDVKGYEEAGLSKGWWNYRDKERHEYLNDIAMRIRIDTAFRAKRLLAEAAERAANVLVTQLDDKKRPAISQRAAIEVLDRTIGKPSQKIEQENSGETTIRVELVGDED